MKKILFVEDDVMIATGLVYALENEGYTVVHAGSVDGAVNAISKDSFDLAILDMQLPDGTGLNVREKLKDTNTSIMILTVVDDEGDIVRAFDGGADDYITKPFRLRELLARVKRTLNKHEDTGVSFLEIGNVRIDTAAAKSYINDTLLDLTALEYRLLLTFASNKGKMLTRSHILESLWDSAGNFVEDNTLTVYIKRLREKLGDAVNIETVRGIGYRAD